MSVINGFPNTLSNQNLDKARNYCVYGSGLYNNFTNLENVVVQWSSMIENVTLDYSFNISNIIITGQYATAHGSLTIDITVNGASQKECGEQTMNLEKVNNSWKIY